MIRRRMFLAGSAALAMPAISRGAERSVLRFIPQSDVTVIDPVLTTAYVTRNHAALVFDTLFGMNGTYDYEPQMLAGSTTDNDGRLWNLTLRDGLRFHDNQPVLARDCVASIRRWAARDAVGAKLMAATDDLSAPDDRTIRFRLNKPFPLLPFALGKTATPMCAMMPERLAQTDAFKPVPELIGSGPFRWVAQERVAGSRAVYERFTGYNPREGGTPAWTAGPKVVNFDRIQWMVIPDDATAAAALQSNEADWWEIPNSDLVPALSQAGHIRVEVKDPTGVIGFMRMNCLQPPFSDVAIRRALLGAVNQKDYMAAIAGDDPKMWRADVGVFCPGTAFASDVGMEVLTGPRDLGKVRAAIKAAGYDGARTVLLVATDTNYRRAMGEVGADMLKKSGLNVQEVDTDWGTLVHRRDNPGPVDQGGWSAIFTTLSGLDLSNPSGQAFQANGRKAWFGWPSSPKLEELRAAWYDAPDLATQKRICGAIQQQWWTDAPQLPIGQWFQPTAWRDSLDGIVNGFPVFWGVRRSA